MVKTDLLHPRSPLRTLLYVLMLVFSAEFGVMVLLKLLSFGWTDSPQLALLDATLLTAVLAPAFWIIIVRPLQALWVSRGHLLTRLFDAQEQERQRLARELHDELGQQLTAVLIAIRSVELAPDLATAKERAARAAAAGAGGLNEVRRIAHGLRPAVLDDLGLRPAIERMCDEFEQSSRIPVRLSLELAEDDRYPPQVELCIFRILQESLTNAARHAQPRSIEVALAERDRRLILTVSDDGVGFDPKVHRRFASGLHGLRERVDLLNGSIRIRSSPGRGTTISAELPAARMSP